jgi:two-component system heavy metal sensor histidine kinase CusS
VKLRHRLAIAFAVTSTAILLASRLVTIESFRRVQEYELDEGLRARARQEGSEIALVGRKALETEYDAQSEVNPLEQLVTYGALYRADGTVVADTPSFAHAPSLREMRIQVDPVVKPPTAPFDFRFRDKVLRGVLVEVNASSPAAERQYLLLAASRRDMDADARQLLAVGWWVALAWLPVTLAVGWWFGRRMTLGIEALVAAARRVTAGELRMPIESAAVSRDAEVAVLGDALREMVSRLEALIQTERRFASHAAHELRSPLTALRGELELALRRKRTAEEYEAAVADALDDTNRLIDLSEDLLVVARLGSGTPEQVGDTGARELIDEAVAASLAASRSVAVNVEVDEGAAGARVQGPASSFLRMLRNLLDNAVTHGGAGGAVRVRISRGTGRLLRVAVEDDGPGVSAEDRDRIFDHFHRGADARQDSGAGLGLGIAREIARRHGGDVVLDSPSKPTRFVVTLPLSGA